jgi:hypothetical protein
MGNETSKTLTKINTTSFLTHGSTKSFRKNETIDVNPRGKFKHSLMNVIFRDSSTKNQEANTPAQPTFYFIV